MKLRKIIFSCGLSISVLICASTVLAIDWYSSPWTIPNSWHIPTRTSARPATSNLQWTKVTNVSDPKCNITAAIFKEGQACSNFEVLEYQGYAYAHCTEGKVNKGDYIQAGFMSSNDWYDVQATIHWAP